jgi:hypothetical protein
VNLVYVILLSRVILLDWRCEAANCSECQDGSAMSALFKQGIQYIYFPGTVGPETWDKRTSDSPERRT